MLAEPLGDGVVVPVGQVDDRGAGDGSGEPGEVTSRVPGEVVGVGDEGLHRVDGSSGRACTGSRSSGS